LLRLRQCGHIESMNNKNVPKQVVITRSKEKAKQEGHKKKME